MERGTEIKSEKIPVTSLFDISEIPDKGTVQSHVLHYSIYLSL